MTRAEWQFAAGMAILIWCACSPVRPAPLDFSGEWAGTTSQGRPITFTVSSEQRVTAVAVDYAFGGCSGTVTVSPSAALANTNGAASAVVVHAPNGINGPSRTIVNFLFSSTTHANGALTFVDYPTCGNGNATWTADKR